MTYEAPNSTRGAVADDASILTRLDDGAWAIGAFLQLLRTGALTAKTVTLATVEDRAAADVLAAVGLLHSAPDGLRPASAISALFDSGMIGPMQQGLMSSLRQLAAVVGIVDSGSGWRDADDETLIAQGKSSAFGGQMLALFGLPSLEGLSDCFASGGDFLDVGVGVGELSAAFCAAVPLARVVGLDVLPRALELARATVAERGLGDRVELRLQSVADLDDRERFDLAWMPAPFLAAEIFAEAVVRVRSALRPGGWVVIGAGQFSGAPLAVAVTSWKTVRAGGTGLPADAAREVLEGAGFVDFAVLPSPPGAPALYGARRPPA